jgi:hypothetical protein
MRYVFRNVTETDPAEKKKAISNRVWHSVEGIRDVQENGTKVRYYDTTCGTQRHSAVYSLFDSPAKPLHLCPDCRRKTEEDLVSWNAWG